MLTKTLSNNSFINLARSQNDSWLLWYDVNEDLISCQDDIPHAQNKRADRIVAIANKLIKEYMEQKKHYFDANRQTSGNLNENLKNQSIFVIRNIQFENLAQNSKEQNQKKVLTNNALNWKKFQFRMELLQTQILYATKLYQVYSIDCIQMNNVHKILCRSSALLEHKSFIIDHLMLRFEEFILSQITQKDGKIFTRRSKGVQNNQKTLDKLKQQLAYYKERKHIFASNAYVDLLLSLGDISHGENDSASDSVNINQGLTKTQILSSFKSHQKYKERLIEQFRCLQLCTDVLQNKNLRCLRKAGLCNLLKFLYFHLVNVNNDDRYDSHWQYSYDFLTTITKENLNKWEQQSTVTDQEDIIFRVLMTMLNEIQYVQFNFTPDNPMQDLYMKYILQYNSKNLMIISLNDKQAYDYKICILKQNAQSGNIKCRRYYNKHLKQDDNISESDHSESAFIVDDNQEPLNIICAHQLFPTPPQAQEPSEQPNDTLNIYQGCIVVRKAVYDSKNKKHYVQQVFRKLGNEIDYTKVRQIQGNVQYLWQIGLGNYQYPLPVEQPENIVSLSLTNMESVQLSYYTSLRCLSLSKITKISILDLQKLVNLNRCYFYLLQSLEGEDKPDVVSPIIDTVQYWPSLQSLNLISLISHHTLVFKHPMRHLQQLVIQYNRFLEKVIIDLDRTKPDSLETLYIEREGNIEDFSVEFKGEQKILPQLQFIDCPGCEELLKYSYSHNTSQQ